MRFCLMIVSLLMVAAVARAQEGPTVSVGQLSVTSQQIGGLSSYFTGRSLIGNKDSWNLGTIWNTGASVWRDAANGMYRAGLYEDPLALKNGQVKFVEFGYEQSWTTDKGYPGNGVHIGISGGGLLYGLQKIDESIDVSPLWKPLGKGGNFIRFNGDFSWLKSHPDGGKKFAWGAGFDVNVPFSVVNDWLKLGL